MRLVSIGIVALVVTLAAGLSAEAQSTTAQQPPVKPPAGPPGGTAPAGPPGSAPVTPAPAPGTAQPPAASGQAPGATAPATPAAPLPSVPSSRKFTSDSGIIFNVIKPDKTADFELVMTRVKEALGKSQDPKRKQQALSWRVFKGLESGVGGNVVYIFWFDPAVKDQEYTLTDILREAFPNEAQDLWAKLTACYASGMVMLNLQQTANMSPNAAAIAK